MPPAAWLDWVRSGRAKALARKTPRFIRSIEEQRPDTPTKAAILRVVFEYFEQAPIAFEAFAARSNRRASDLAPTIQALRSDATTSAASRRALVRGPSQTRSRAPCVRSLSL